jgi:hypothetical protein
MGKLRDQLLREAEADNRKLASELTSNSVDGRLGFSNLWADIKADASRERMRSAREMILANSHLLSRIGLDLNDRLCTAVVGLSPSEASHVVSEFLGKPEESEIGYTGPIERSRR